MGLWSQAKHNFSALRRRYGMSDAKSWSWNIHVASGPKAGVHVLELPFEYGTAGSAVAYRASKILRVPERLILALPNRGGR